MLEKIYGIAQQDAEASIWMEEGRTKAWPDVDARSTEAVADWKRHTSEEMIPTN
jgi:hypothetical protein